MRDPSHERGASGGAGGGSRVPFHIHAAHFGKAKLGATTVTFDDEALTIIASTGDERSERVRLTTIDAVHLADEVLIVELQDGTHLRLHGERLIELRTTVLECCRTVPEVTRALRAFGSRRGQRSTRNTGSEEQHRFFAPLLLARRAASVAIGPAAVIAAFDAEVLAQGFNTALERFAEDRFRESPPARRALTAELTDIAEPLHVSLDLLRHAARAAAGDLENLRNWREWASAVRSAFETADRVWLNLDAALDSVDRRLPAETARARTPTFGVRRPSIRRRSE